MSERISELLRSIERSRGAREILQNPFFKTFLIELKAENYEEWTRTRLVADRELIYHRYLAIQAIQDKIVTEANQLEALQDQLEYERSEE